jgi:hypothetical protein
MSDYRSEANDPTPHASGAAPDLVERVARAICIADGDDPDMCVRQIGRAPTRGTIGHAIPTWECTERAWERRLPAAHAVIALVLEEATKIKRPNISRRYCTNDEAFFNEGFDAAINAMHVLISKEKYNE